MQFLFNRPKQVLNLLFVHVQVAVSSYPKGPCSSNLVTGKERTYVETHHVAEKKKDVGTFGTTLNLDQSGKNPGHRHDRHKLPTFLSSWIAQTDYQVQRFVVYKREWMRGVNRQRRQNGIDLATKVVLEPNGFLWC